MTQIVNVDLVGELGKSQSGIILCLPVPLQMHDIIGSYFTCHVPGNF